MNIGTLTIEMAANVARLSKDMDAARRTVERTFGSIEKDVARLKGLIGGLFAGVSATMFVGKLVAVQREFDVLNSSLKTVTGSAAAAEREMAWLKQFAKETPFGLAQATQGFVKMQALGLNPTRAALTSFGNTASAMGKDLNQMIEAVADASTGEFERLKEFGIKAKKEGDNVSLTFQGVTTNIGNNAAEITAYLQAIGDNQFAGAMAERAKTLDGAIAGLGDTWDELFRTINAQPAGGIIYDSVVLATNAIEDMITILNALNGATAENAKQTGAMKVLQDGMAIVFETVAVLGVNLKYVLVQIGNEIGGIAAQIAAVLRGDFAQAGAIRDMMVADAEAARKEVDAVTARILNARKEALAAQGVQQAVAAGAPAVARALGGSSDAAKKFADQLENLLNKINGKDAGVDTDFYKNLELLRDGYNKGKLSLEEYMALAEKYIKQQKFYQDQVKESAAAEEERRKAVERAAEEYAKAIQSAEDMVDQIQFETRALQMTNVEREVAIRLRDLERKGIKAGSAEYEEYAKRIREAVVGKDMVEASIEQQRKAQQEWQKTWDHVGQSFTDALMQGGKSVKEYLISLFRTMVLRPMLQPIVGGIMDTLGGGSGGAAGKTGGLLSTGSSLMNLGSSSAAAAGLATQFAYSGIGASLGLSTAAGAGYAAPVYAAGGQLLSAGSTGVAAGGMTAGGSALASMASAAPYALAALAVADAVGLFGKRGGPQSGQYGDISASGYKSSYTMSGGDSLGNQALAQSAYNQVASLYAMAGKQAADLTIGQGYKLDPSGSASGVAYRNISVGGKTITGGTFDGNSGGQWYGGNSDGAGAAAYLGKLTTSEIKALVDAIGDSGLSTTIEKLSANFEDLADGMAKYATAQAVQKTLSETLRQSTLSDSEKLAETQKNLAAGFSSIGVAVPKSAEEFRALVDGLDLTTKAAQDQLAAMNGLSASFLEVAAAQKAAEQTRAGWQMKLDVLEGKYTEEQLGRYFELIGTQDEATKSLMQQVWAMEDQAAAAKEAAAALDAAAASAAAAQEKAAAIAAKQRDLDIQLLDATGQTSAATAARRADALKALDNDQQRATQMQIWAAQDAAEANAKAAEAAQQAAQAAQQAAAEQARAQQQIRDEWQRTADSIFDTIRKLRGEVASPAQSYAAAQAQFSIATAAARAGDQGAAGQLPQLAQSVVDLGKAIAVTRVDQQLLTARTIASLSATMEGMRQFGIEIPAFAAGTNRVPQDMLAMVHKDEAIIPAAFNPWAGGMQGGNAELIAEVRALRAEVAELRAANSAENRAIASATAKTTKTMERFDDGDSLKVRVVT